MTVELSPELEALVKQKVTSGPYHTTQQVLEEALRALDERDRAQATEFDGLCQQVSVGLEQLRRGEGLPGDEVFERLREKSRLRRETGP